MATTHDTPPLAPAEIEQHIPLASQVGGHPGVMSSADGNTIIKPCLPAEKAFYEAMQDAPEGSAMARLRTLCPEFRGVTVDGNSIKLQNLSNDFSKPNILDIKLGTQLYDEDASPEKKERMIQAAMKTTSLETGVRMTGFQVFDAGTNEYVTTPKSYGKSITSSQLPEAFAKFLPVLSPTLDPSKSVETAPAIGSTPIGHPPALLAQVIDGIYADVAAIKDAMERLYLRMVGGSILVIYEGDTDVLRLALSGEENGGFKPPAYRVRLIDFAHTKLKSEQDGVDKGVILGLGTTLKYLEGRKEEIMAGVVTPST